MTDLSRALAGKDCGENTSSVVGSFFSPPKDKMSKKDDPAKDPVSSETDLL